jgi:hypothetical protein
MRPLFLSALGALEVRRAVYQGLRENGRLHHFAMRLMRLFRVPPKCCALSGKTRLMRLCACTVLVTS